jgi:hypothetical protein
VRCFGAHARDQQDPWEPCLLRTPWQLKCRGVGGIVGSKVAKHNSAPAASRLPLVPRSKWSLPTDCQPCASALGRRGRAPLFGGQDDLTMRPLFSWGWRHDLFHQRPYCGHGHSHGCQGPGAQSLSPASTRAAGGQCRYGRVPPRITASPPRLTGVRPPATAARLRDDCPGLRDSCLVLGSGWAACPLTRPCLRVVS